MLRLKFQCKKCGREWEYDLEELNAVTLFKESKGLLVTFEDYETKCECGEDLRNEIF